MAKDKAEEATHEETTREPAAASTSTETGDDSNVKTTLIVVGVVAAAVSAATAAYIFWSRHQRSLAPKVESVQDLLEQAHDKMRQIEQKLGDLHPASAAVGQYTNGSGAGATTVTAGSAAA
jgi:uncharacterized protein HemX